MVPAGGRGRIDLRARGGIVRFRILGPLEVWSGQSWSGIGAPKWRALLAALLISPGQVVSTDRLIDEVWGDDPPTKASNVVAIYVLRLRRLIGDPGGQILVTRQPGYQLRLDPGDLDAQRFAAMMSDGRRALAVGEAELASAVLTEALGLWRGQPFADVARSALVSAEAGRLEEARIAAVALRSEAELACGRGSSLVADLQRMAADHPLHEELWALLMRALQAAGRQAEALDTYARARAAIADQLGVDPGAELQWLHKEILEADARPRGQPGAGQASAPGSWARSAAGTATRRAKQAAHPPPSAPPSASVAQPRPMPTDGTDELPDRRTEARHDRGADARHDRAGGRRDAVLGVPNDGAAGEPIDGAAGAPGAGAPGDSAADEPSDGAAGAPYDSGAEAARAGTADPRRSGPPRFAPSQLPADIPDFTGRAEHVKQICDLLSQTCDQNDRSGAVTVAVVVGTGGLGKTTLAVHAAHRLRGRFPDGQLYVSLLGASSRPVAPTEVLARFLRELGVDGAQVPVTEEERAALYRTRLAGRRVLVVLDDARDAAQVRSLLPGSATCGVLVTSRNHLPDLAGARLVDLDVLNAEEARALLIGIVGAARLEAEPGPTAEVLAACAGLPLAIRIAGARLAARVSWTIQTLARRLANERRRIDEFKVGDLAVRACFQVSFASLPKGGDCEVDPARAFRLLGLWHGPSISLAAAAALLGEPEAEVADAFEVLLDAHLLQSQAADRYRFHDLLRVYAAERAEAEETQQDRDAAVFRILTWYVYTAETAARVISPQHTRVPLGPTGSSVHPLSFASLEEALAWCESERAGMVAATRLAAESELYDLAWKLPAAAMSFFFRRSQWADWVVTHQIGLESARKRGDSLAEAWMLNNLGMAFGEQRMEEAVGCFERSLAIYREIGDVPGETRAANNVAKAYFELRRFGEALDAARQSLAIQRLAGNRYGEGVALGNLGDACRELGRFDEAIECLGQALVIFRELGDQHAEADALSDLGGVLLGLDRVEDALGCLRDSLAIWRAIGERHGEAATLRRLGVAWRHAARPEQARESLSAALGIFEALGDHVQAAESRMWLEALSQGVS